MTKLRKHILYSIACNNCGAQAPEVEFVDTLKDTRTRAEKVALAFGFHFFANWMLCERCWNGKT